MANAYLFLDMPAHVYHADPCPSPSLSSGVLRTLLDESPLHAWHKHPRLNKDAKEFGSKRNMEIGSAIHKLVLGRGEEIVIVQADDYKTKAAREERDAAIAQHKIVVLPDDFARAKAAAAMLSESIEDSLSVRIVDCHTEAVVTWTEDGQWRRIMIDLVTKDLRHAVDVKSTGMSVSPEAATRGIYSSGYHIQAAFYLRGLDALDPAGYGKRRFSFAYGENDAPFAVAPLIDISQVGCEIANHEVQRGCEIWGECMEADDWPGHFRPETHQAEPPGWMVKRFEDSFDLAHKVITED